MQDVIQCSEFDEIGIDVERLLTDGKLRFDPRVAERGYFNISLSRGRVVLRADRYVGLIPLTQNISVRVVPRASIANITFMVVKSGELPSAIPDFSRGYMPGFTDGEGLERVYCEPFVVACERVVRNGFIKGYSKVTPPPQWKGRLLLSDTIRSYRARNVRYRAAFEHTTLGYSCVENIGLKAALVASARWMLVNEPRSPFRGRIDNLLREFRFVPDPLSSRALLVRDLAAAASKLPSHYSYYREALWTAYLLLQGRLPNLELEGFVSIDSLVINLSRVFESYVRRVLMEAASGNGWTVVNGEDVIYPFFIDSDRFRVKPDIIIFADGRPIGVLDVKYKLSPKESDRYEVLSFMDALGASAGAFICPAIPGSRSEYLGETAGAKKFSVLRFDLAADLALEGERLVENVRELVTGSKAFR